MKFMMMHKHDKRTEAGLKPPPALIAAMGDLIGGMAQAGKLLDGAGLGASTTRSRVTFKRGNCAVVHGPFAGSENELPAGYVMVKVRSRDEAIDWATKIGTAIAGDLELEVGKVNEPWDIGIGEKPADAPLRYLIIHKATPASEPGKVPDLAAVKQEMTTQGVLLTSAELTPSSRAKRITYRGGSRKVTDGPFAESKELIGGYGVVDLASMEECLAFSSKYAAILLTDSDTLEIDIRPVAKA
jgi:hypothetical protein